MTNQKPEHSRSSLILIGAGSVFTGMVLAGIIVGYFFDEIFSTKPVFLIIFTFLGFVGGFQKLHKLLVKTEK